MLTIEVHRHPAVTAILDVRGIDGLDLVAADRAHQQNANWRFILYGPLVNAKPTIVLNVAYLRHG
jgi:hypothetical protein